EVAGKAVAGDGDAWAVAIAEPDGEAAYLDLTQLGPDDEKALGAWLADPQAAKTLHGAKAAAHMLAARSMDLEGVVFDTELAAYLCYPDQRGYDLGDLAVRHIGRELKVAEPDGAQGALDLSLEGETEGQAEAVLASAVGGAVSGRGATGLLTDVGLPLSGVRARMERTGIAAGPEYLTGLERQFARGVADAAAQAYDVIGREVNLGSPKQLQEVLFDQLGMPRTKKIKTGYTTDAASLQDLFVKTEHPFLAHLLAHRDVSRLRVTVEGLLKSVAADGRIHTTFQQTIAATGRLSSTDPNLQNIPIRTEAGRQIR